MENQVSWSLPPALGRIYWLIAVRRSHDETFGCMMRVCLVIGQIFVMDFAFGTV